VSDDADKLKLALRARGRRFVSELNSAWAELAALVASLDAAASAVAATPHPVESLDDFASRNSRFSRALLLDPLSRYEEVRPIRRCLEARQELDRHLLETAQEAGWDPRIIEQELGRRKPLDTALLQALTATCLGLRDPWRATHASRSGDLSAWRQRQSASTRQAETALEATRRWAETLGDPTPTGPRVSLPRLDAFTETLWRQQRAVRAELETEREICNLSGIWIQAAAAIASGLRQEREAIRAQAFTLKQWLDAGAPEDGHIKADSLVLADLDERLLEFTRLIEEETTQRLPERVEFVIPASSPNRRTRWHVSHPRRAFLSASCESGCDLLLTIFQQAWEDNVQLLRHTARALEVVEYWRSVRLRGGAESQSLWEEALRNASALLADNLEAAAAPGLLNSNALRVVHLWAEDAWLTLEADRLDWRRILSQRRSRELAGAAFRSAQRRIRLYSGHLHRFARASWHRLLQAIGWHEPIRPAATPVERRLTLRDTFLLSASSSELPGVYRSLFRLSALEDPRLLIGRENEMRGIEQAFQDWRAGRFAACLLIGARGSGKTSLLNCAVSEVLHDCEIVRGQFSRRIRSAQEIDDFLHLLLGCQPGDDLLAAFSQRPRVVIIEEAERTFLRTVGGFEGTRALTAWIQRTASSTLWLIAANERGCQLMDVATGFSQVFSHRINAMSVTRANLEQAILARHRLSGLRLRFAMPPAGHPHVSRLRNSLGWEDAPQSLFFDSLHQQSGGIFRSAFQLWLSSVERYEGEYVDIRHPLSPIFSPLRQHLLQPDHFSLLAIQQHGSLTPPELSEVLRDSPAESAARLERLQAMGLIESDPTDPGLRIRPDALVFVNDLLRRLNFG
jgi:hypothetical protein